MPRDHPRLRGEQGIFAGSAGLQPGSPPLARGTDNAIIFSTPAVGITPACAGNSFLLSATARAIKDHPRLRGEQKYSSYIGTINAGSPPLARGTGRVADAAWRPCRITPACAGNRLRPRVYRLYNGDHPRLRGEQRLQRPKKLSKRGSPPLARGTVSI